MGAWEQRRAALTVAAQPWPVEERLEVLRMLGLTEAGFKWRYPLGVGSKVRRKVVEGVEGGAS